MREVSEPWPAPEENIPRGRGADALDGLGGEDLDGGEVVVAGCGVNMEVGILTGEKVERAAVGAGGGIEG